MNLSRSLSSIGAAALVSVAVVSSALAFGRVLQREAARASHQQPMVDHWRESVTPTSPTLVTQGRKLFLDSCAHCHGADATGDEGPNLHGLQVSDRYISHMIIYGEPHEMPSFAKKHGSADIAALTAYIRSLEN
ncbi:MAG: cytochrome c class [Verrucomicrobia bacterium]|nr:cytochrome c class [Verrucomicrobiota bacterium]